MWEIPVISEQMVSTMRMRDLKAIKTWGGLFEQIQYRMTVLGFQQEEGGSPGASLRLIEALSSRSGYGEYAHLL